LNSTNQFEGFHMIDYSDGARAGTRAGLQFLTAPQDVRDAFLATIPVAKREWRSWTDSGDEWQRATAAFWLEFFDAFYASIASVAGR
jgi:hypothetical protein